jgi:hypothetical protein
LTLTFKKKIKAATRNHDFFGRNQRSGDMCMETKRMTIIPALHGKLTRDGKLGEPDIYCILQKWLERHPTFKEREQDMRIVRGRSTLREGVRTEVVSASVVKPKDIADYDPAQDRDLYEHYLAEESSYEIS